MFYSIFRASSTSVFNPLSLFLRKVDTNISLDIKKMATLLKGHDKKSYVLIQPTCNEDSFVGKKKEKKEFSHPDERERERERLRYATLIAKVYAASPPLPAEKKSTTVETEVEGRTLPTTTILPGCPLGAKQPTLH